MTGIAMAPVLNKWTMYAAFSALLARATDRHRTHGGEAEHADDGGALADLDADVLSS